MVKPVVNDDDVESLTSPAEQSGTLDGTRSTALPPSCWASFFLDHADGTDQLGRVFLGEDDPSGAWFERWHPRATTARIKLLVELAKG